MLNATGGLRGRSDDVVREIVCDKITSFLARYCRCVKIRATCEDRFRFESIIDDVERALSMGLSLNLGFVEVIIRRSLLSKKVFLRVGDKVMNREEAVRYIAQIRSFLEWYRSDCDVRTIVDETIVTNDFNLVDFINKNIDGIRVICSTCSSSVQLDYSMLEESAVSGVIRGIEGYVRSQCRQEEVCR